MHDKGQIKIGKKGTWQKSYGINKDYRGRGRLGRKASSSGVRRGRCGLGCRGLFWRGGAADCSEAVDWDE